MNLIARQHTREQLRDFFSVLKPANQLEEVYIVSIDVTSNETFNFVHRNLHFDSAMEAFANNYINGGDIRASFAASMGGGGVSGIAIDRDAKLSLAYVMNNCHGTVMDGDDRAAPLRRTLYAVF